MEPSTVPLRRTGASIHGLRVEVVEGPDRGRSAEASGPSLSIGTAQDNDLVLQDPSVSRYHLELRREAKTIVLEDLRSTNGTLIAASSAEVRVERAYLEPGVILALGRSKVRVDDGAMIEVEALEEDRLGRVLGRSPAMRRLMAKLDSAASSDASVLLLGETGVGKEVLARAIHEASDRARGPFETVDCGVILPTLVQSELFGHEKGAFTGADAQHLGAFQRANGGTIFLDEIGELPKDTQANLLGALERRMIRPVGGSRQIPIDVRVLAATHRDLRAEVNTGAFRQDLYYRLAVLTLKIPPLRQRTEDIPMLVEHFAREVGQEELAAKLLGPEVLAKWKAHDWPGNVRELRNVVEATLALGEAPPLERTTTAVRAGGFDPQLMGSANYHELRNELLTDFERKYLTELLRRASGNVSAAARLSGLSRTHLIAMLKRHNIDGRVLFE